jgi:hypothetical protein
VRVFWKGWEWFRWKRFWFGRRAGATIVSIAAACTTLATAPPAETLMTGCWFTSTILRRKFALVKHTNLYMPERIIRRSLTKVDVSAVKLGVCKAISLGNVPKVVVTDDVVGFYHFRDAAHQKYADNEHSQEDKFDDIQGQ